MYNTYYICIYYIELFIHIYSTNIHVIYLHINMHICACACAREC